MKLDPGMIVIIVVVGLFYVRILMLRGQHRAAERKAVLEQIKAVEAQKGKSHRNQPPVKKAAPQMDQPMFDVTSWWIIGPALIAIEWTVSLPVMAAFFMSPIGMRQSSRSFENVPWAVVTPASTAPQENPI